MKFDDLKSVAHNLATSVSDGASFLFGTYSLAIHEDALMSPGGRITIDFLTGSILEGNVSEGVSRILSRSPTVLAELCAKSGVDPASFAVLRASYGVDQVYGWHFTVTVADQSSRHSEELYKGITGARMRRGHKVRAPARS